MNPKQSDWQDARISPLPADAPPYRLFLGAPLATVWVAGYDENRWTVTDIDRRFTLDRTTMPAPESDQGFGRFRRGDLVIWVGPGLDGLVEEDLIWEPSLVIEAGGVGDGMARITSIRDGSLNCCGIDEAQGWGIDWRSHLGGNRPPQAVDPAVLDIWQLNVWCELCGHLGSPVVWGLNEPRQERDDESLPRWPEGMAIHAGCSLPVDPHLYECLRCGAQWGRGPSE